MRSQTISIGTIIPTDALAPNNSARIRTFTIARPGKPVLEKPRLNAPNSANSQVAVEMSPRRSKVRPGGQSFSVTLAVAAEAESARWSSDLMISRAERFTVPLNFSSPLTEMVTGLSRSTNWMANRQTDAALLIGFFQIFINGWQFSKIGAFVELKIGLEDVKRII